MSEAISQGPNLSPKRAIGTARRMQSAAPISPPKKEAHTPRLRALPGCPFLVMGKPSKTVHTEEGVPGIPSSIPDTSPPEYPPTYTAIIVDNPSMGVIPKVNGNVSTTAMVIVKPGMAAAIMPARVPTVISPIILAVKTSPKAETKTSIFFHLPFATAQGPGAVCSDKKTSGKEQT